MSPRHRRARRRLCWALAGAFGMTLASVGAEVGGDVDRKQDMLWLRQGDPLVGEMLNDRLTVRTAYGAIEVPIRKVVAMRLAEGGSQIDTVQTVHGDRITGFVEDIAFRFRPERGPLVTVRRERVREIRLRAGTAEAVGTGSGQLVLLGNGDSLSGRVRGEPFRLATPHVDLAVRLGDVRSIAFEEGQPILARVRMQSGERFEGVWPDEDLTIELELGSTLRVYPTRIQVIDCQPGRAFKDPIGANPALVARSPSASEWEGPAPPGMVWVPPGAFVMGSPVDEADRGLDEGPQTKVTLSRGSWMGKSEVTQAEYQAVMGTNPSLFVGDPRRPVERVNWRDAMEYCTRLTRAERSAGRLPDAFTYRLPTEAEWEYACRAGTATRFSHGDDPDGYDLERYAWFNGNSDSETHPVGTREPNPWGLHDMHGNVLELCLDGATGTLPGGEVTDYRTPGEGLLRAARGGSWLYGAKACRSGNRDSYGESTRSSDVGFRIILAASATQ